MDLSTMYRANLVFDEAVDPYSRSRPNDYRFLNQATVYNGKNNEIVAAFTELSKYSKYYKGYVGGNIVNSFKVDNKADFKRNYIEAIKNEAVPAPFGKGSETILDPNIRNALEIPASRLKIEYYDYLWEKLLKKVCAMAPQGYHFDVELYKLQIYEKGGYFNCHIDTLHGSDHYATLVVMVYYENEDEDAKDKSLVLDIDGKETPIGLWPGEFVCFLTDTPHEIKPVLGNRMVLQYDLYLRKNSVISGSEEFEDKAGNSKESEDKESSSEESEEDNDSEEDYSGKSYYKKEFSPTLTEASKEQQIALARLSSLIPEFISRFPNDSVCFMLTHQYPMTVSMNCLRGGDRLLYEMLQKDYHLALGIATNPIEQTDEAEYENIKDLYVMDYKCFQRAKDYVQGNEQLQPQEKGKTHVFFGNSATFKQLRAKQYIDYTGNESQQGEYIYASLVLAIGPPISLRRENDALEASAENRKAPKLE